MSKTYRLSRRRFLDATANVVAAGTVMALLPSMASAAKPMTVGFIYVGPRQDFGWNQVSLEKVLGADPFFAHELGQAKAVVGLIVVETHHLCLRSLSAQNPLRTQTSITDTNDSRPPVPGGDQRYR